MGLLHLPKANGQAGKSTQQATLYNADRYQRVTVKQAIVYSP